MGKQVKIVGVRWFWLLCAAVGCVNEPPVPKAAASVPAREPKGAGYQTSDDDWLGVIVVLKADASLPAERGRVVANLERSMGGQLRLIRRFQELPLVAAEVRRTQFAALAGLAQVDALQIDEDRSIAGAPSPPESASPAAAVHAKAAWNLGWGGQGVRVAVLDTGVDPWHPDLLGRVVAQKCFSVAGCPPYGAMEGDNASDPGGHGTRLATVIAGAGKVGHAGVAPNAELVAVRVLDRDGVGKDSDILAGLDWILGPARDLGVRAVSLSIAGKTLYAQGCDASQPAWSAAVAAAAAKGVLVVAPAGDRAARAAMASPACVTGVASAGASYLRNAAAGVWPDLCADRPQRAGALACLSNRAKGLFVVAPGMATFGAPSEGRTSAIFGSSAAAAVVTGIAALVSSCRPDWLPATLKEALVHRAASVVDSASGLRYARADAATAIGACRQLR